MNAFRALLPGIFICLLVASCSDDDDTSFVRPDPFILTVLAEDAEYTSLLEALQKTELDTLLREQGPFTIFAPTNEAFSKFLSDSETTLETIDKKVLSELLLNHMLNSEETTRTLSQGYFKTLANGPDNQQNISIFIETSNNTLKLNNIATVSSLENEFDIEANNGIVHKIDKIIPVPTLLTFLSADPELSGIASAATTNSGFTTDFAEILSALDADITFLAPINEGFQLASEDFEKLSDSLKERVLLNHFIEDIVISTSVSSSYTTTKVDFDGDSATQDNLSIYISSGTDLRFNGILSTATTDIIASNGVMHKVRDVVPLPTLNIFIAEDSSLNTLNTALKREEDFTFSEILQETDESPAPITVFAPVNDAFSDLITELDISELAEVSADSLSNILSNHLVPDATIRSSDFFEGQELTTLNDKIIRINVSDTIQVMDEKNRTSKIILQNIQATNGVLHTLDKVLLPEIN